MSRALYAATTVSATLACAHPAVRADERREPAAAVVPDKPPEPADAVDANNPPLDADETTLVVTALQSIRKEDGVACITVPGGELPEAVLQKRVNLDAKPGSACEQVHGEVREKGTGAWAQFVSVYNIQIQGDTAHLEIEFFHSGKGGSLETRFFQRNGPSSIGGWALTNTEDDGRF